MRFFFLRDYQDWLLAVFLGMLLAVIIYLGFRSYGYSSDHADKGGEELSRYPDRIEVGDSPVPPFIVFLVAAFVVWVVFYVIFIGINGGPI